MQTNTLSIGKFEQIGGVECYVATPTADYPSNKVLLYLMDIFGIHLPNHQVSITDINSERSLRLACSPSSLQTITLATGLRS